MRAGRNGISITRRLVRCLERSLKSDDLGTSPHLRGSATSNINPPLNHSTARYLSVAVARWESTQADLKSTQAVVPPSIGESLVSRDQPSSTSAFEALVACPGCGALAQILEPDVAGFYSRKREAVRSFIRSQAPDHAPANTEDAVFTQAVQNADPALQQALGSASTEDLATKQHPLCDRCHDLLHHHRGTSIAHPSLESLAETLAESPYKHNHVYHVLDAADFPMSVVPEIQRILSVAPQRSKNRRAPQASYSRGKKTEISFIITRSDLLAPMKEQVDRLMPYLVETLRDALGRSARDVRLGNVRCVSAKRGWWTKDVKADVWKRGGGGWMVGKVNVGKSNLFEVIFPKGRNQDVNFDSVRNQAQLQDQSRQASLSASAKHTTTSSQDDTGLLPPAREETPYPTMPTVSSLPGTTASPIRVPFGGGKGELIDLPGLERSEIASFVRDEEQENIIMKKRIVPEQYSIGPGSSLLLGGLIRISPKDQEINILAYPFVPLQPHATRTEKAIEALQGLRSPIPFVTKEGVSANLETAGVFALDTDITKQRAGPLVAKDAVGLKPQNLPFRVLATDILIESIGWIELVAQVRRRDFLDGDGDAFVGGGASYPEVEVFSPEGRFVASRRSMSAWSLGGPKKETLKKRVRPINRRLKERWKRS